MDNKGASTEHLPSLLREQGHVAQSLQTTQSVALLVLFGIDVKCRISSILISSCITPKGDTTITTLSLTTDSTKFFFDVLYLRLLNARGK